MPIRHDSRVGDFLGVGDRLWDYDRRAGLTQLRDSSGVEMIWVDIGDQDEVRLLRPGEVGLTADRIDNDDRGAMLDLHAGVPEGADDEVPTAGRNARRRWHLGIDD